MKWSFEKMVALWFTAAALILVVVGLVSYRSLTGLAEDAQRVSHSHQVIERLNHLHDVVAEAENAQRGYLLTGHVRYMQQYEAAPGVIAADLSSLRALLADNPAQVQKLYILEQDAANRMTFLKSVLSHYETEGSQGSQTAQRALASNQGQSTIDSVTNDIAQMQRVEHELLQARSDQVTISTRRATWTSWAGIGLSFLILGLVYFLITHEMSQRRRVEAALEATNRKTVTIWESMTDAFFSLDTQWRFTHVNSYAARLWHRSAEELIGQNIWKEFPATVSSIFYTEYHRAREEQATVKFETFYPPDNAWREVHVYPSPIGLSVYFRDITERKAAEAALSRMRDELEARVEARTAELAATNAALQIQIAERAGAEAETRTRARQQEAVAELGHRALTDVSMDTLLQDATTLVTATLNVEISSILELLPGGDAWRMRAGTGWKTDVSGHLVAGQANAQAGYTLLSNTPTIVSDLRTETRFEPSQFLLDQGIVSGITVIVSGYEQPFGILAAYTVGQRHFTQDDAHFLEAIANVLAVAIDHHRVETKILPA